MKTKFPSEPTKVSHPMDIAMRDLAESRGWASGYFGDPALINIKHFQADYVRGYRDGWNYAHCDFGRKHRV